MRFRTLIVWCGLVLFCFSANFAPALAIDFPPPSGFVNDFAGVFSESFRQELEADLTAFEKETSVEIAVVTIKSLEETTIDDYAVRLFEAWKIGKDSEDNGILLLVAPNEREVRIEVGYGLEPIITDSRAGKIIRSEIIPSFKEADYEEGVKKGVVGVKNYILSGEPTQEEKAADQIESNFPIVVFAFFILVYLSSFLGRSKRIWPGAMVGGATGGFIGLVLGKMILFGVGFGLLGLFLDWLFSKNYKKLKKAGKSTGWWRSGGGFSSGGGGSFGGFGGGSSGGGGASGSW